MFRPNLLVTLLLIPISLSNALNIFCFLHISRRISYHFVFFFFFLCVQFYIFTIPFIEVTS